MREISKVELTVTENGDNILYYRNEHSLELLKGILEGKIVANHILMEETDR